jgi:hypothetical protein
VNRRGFAARHKYFAFTQLQEESRMQNHSKKFILGKVAIVSAVLTGFLAGPGAPLLRADDCQAKTASYDHKLHDAIAHHGAASKEAQHWRDELNAERDHCWNKEHKWWDEDGHRWHTEHDWDPNDHH